MIFVYILFIFLFLTLSFSKKNDFLRFGLFNKKGFHELHRMILSYGYNYSIKTHIMSTVIFLCVLAFVCYEFQIRFESFLIFACILTFILPYIVLWLYFHSYQEKVFNQFTIFLQTFIAVYKINPKTYPALCECEKVCEGEVQRLIIQMKETLLKDGDIESCMKCLIDYQPHFIVHNLVTLITTIETHGGNYQEGLDLIQDDIDDWIEDVYQFKRIQTSTKNKMMSLCLLSVGIAFLSKNMLQEISFNANSEIYQIACFVFILCLLFTLFMAHRIFSKSWFEKEEKI